MSEDGIEELIDFWRNFEVTSGKLVHEDDLETMKKVKATPAEMTSVSEFFDLTSPGHANYFHLSLSPVPYMGNLRSADIFLLMLNPSAGYADYYTNADPAFGQALGRTLKQEGEKGCLALNPKPWWSSWFCYYEDLFRSTLFQCAETSRVSYWQALEKLSHRLAILELVPYYSAKAAQITDKFLKGLPSAQKARKAAQALQKRAKKRNATVIVKFGFVKWSFEDAEGIIRGQPIRGLNSEAQAAILERLKCQ